MAGSHFDNLGGRYIDFTAPVRFVLADIFAGTVSNAGTGILAANRSVGALKNTDMKRFGDAHGTRLRCWIKCSADATVSYVKIRGAVPDTYKPAGSTKVTALATYVFELPFTALDESFDVFIDTTATVSLVVEEV
jgi:hypothetical protein